MKHKWRIYVSDYGSFEFEGTDEEADAMRKRKAAWEGGNSLAWRITDQRESDILISQVAERWENGEGVSDNLWNQIWKAQCEEEAAK